MYNLTDVKVTEGMSRRVNVIGKMSICLYTLVKKTFHLFCISWRQNDLLESTHSVCMGTARLSNTNSLQDVRC